MKYISRITALLLVLMMLTPTFASALTLGTATQGDLDKLYQEATDSGYEYYPTGYLGIWGEVDAFDTLTNKDAYTFQWYDAEGNALQSYGEDAPEKLRFVYTMETQYFHCVATRVSDGATMTSAIKVIPPADISNPEGYLGFLYDPSIFLDVFGAADTLTIYHMMIDTWNVTMPNGMNLAESILELWWSEREESYFDPYLLCSCVVSGAVASDECVLHPNSDLHVNGCSWKQPEISANVDVSTPESLLMLENVVLAAEERPDVDAYAWQNYVYDPAIAGMRWAVVEYVQGTNLYTIQINKESIQTAYRVVIETTDYNVFESKPLYLGGYDFFNWIHTNQDIQAWMADDSVTLADVVARYNDESDRTNATDYTAGSEGKKVNIQVSEGTFAEDYVLEVEESNEPANLLQTILTYLIPDGYMDAEVLAAFDIAFMGLNSGNELQPAEGHPVTLNFMLDTTNVSIENAKIYIYHMAKQADGTIIPEKVAGPEIVTYGTQMIPVTAASFSDYVAFATDDIHYFDTQVLGGVVNLPAFAGRDMTGYSFQWYQYFEGQPDVSLDGKTYQNCEVFTMLDQASYYCVATPTSEGEPETSELFVVRANVTDYESYLNVLYGYYEEYDLERIYELMTEDWDVSVSYNLADAVMDYWYSNRDPEYYDYDMLCTCVVSGAISSDECMLHPDDIHDANCPWYRAVDVSNFDALKDLELGAEITLTTTLSGKLEWQQGIVNTDGTITWDEQNPIATGETCTMILTGETLTKVYRCVDTDTGVASPTVYIGGEVFFTWAINAADVAAWLALEGNKMEYVLAAYEAYLKGIALAEAIHVTTTETGTMALLELHGLTTLAEIDADGNVIDTRYHIAVATYDATTGTITALGN